MPTLRTRSALCAAALGAAIVPSANAQTMFFSGGEDGYSAEATFSLSGQVLTISLANTSELDVLRPKDVLTGIFFNITQDAIAEAGQVQDTAVLEPIAATVPFSQSMLFGFTGNAGDVSGEWAFRDDLRRGFGGTTHGISAVAAGGFRVRDNFSDDNLFRGRRVGNIDYGLTSEFDDLSTGSRGVRGRLPLTQSAVTFTFSVPEDFELSDIEDVTAHFGKGRRHPTFTLAQTIPAPGVMVTAGAGMLLGMRRRRRRVA